MLTDEHREKIAWLRQYQYLDKEVDRNMKELEKWSSRATSITGSIDAMPRSGGVSDKVGEAVVNFDEVRNQLQECIDQALSLRKSIEDQIGGIEEAYLREIMRARYFDGKTWEEIAFRNNYHWKYVHQLHEKALDQIEI